MVDGIAAVVNGEVITLLELEKAGRLALEERLRTAPAAEQERLRREVLTAVLDQLVLIRIQSQRARQSGVQVSPAEVDTAILNIREDNRMSEVLARLLQERGMTQKEYRSEIEDQIRLSKLVQREIRAKVTATDEEIAAWFTEHRQDWYRPEKIRIRHLLVPLPAGLGRRDRGRTGEGERAARPGRGRDGFRGARARRDAGRRGRRRPGVGGDGARRALPCARGGRVRSARRRRQRAGAEPRGLSPGAGGRKDAGLRAEARRVRASIEQKIAERKTRERYETWVKQIRSEAIVEIRY